MFSVNQKRIIAAQVQRIQELVLNLDELTGMTALLEALASPPTRS